MSECGDQSSPHEVIHLVKRGGLAVGGMQTGDGRTLMTEVALLRQGGPNWQVVGLPGLGKRRV